MSETPGDGAEPRRGPETEDAAPAQDGRPPKPPRRERLAALVTDTNRRPELIDALRSVRRKLPGDPSFGDPLSVSGPGGARAVARAAEKLVGDSPTAARELGLGALQVWQAVLERVGRGRGDTEVTVMFTDLVAFSSWSLTAGDEVTLRLLRAVATAIEPPVAEHRGSVVKRMGDGMMAVFATADDAVRAAVTAKDNLRGVEIEGYRPRMRVGLHTGMPREIGGDWLGVDVNVAARVMAAGGNGHTMLSDATLRALHPDTLTALGRTTKPYRRSLFAAPLNGVPDDLRIYRLTRVSSRA
ncbi:adenylate/guanylate cyclase domain-containing protein [Nocardia farcinica]|uniref:adenylate/guanylate cyclase domain-containing protein n=1 Tax=Nocardia TaxID=1817 RepID=UPI000E06B98C|nr:adenylate/guanylate cyclase domain-containing protein [Nocardia farcinica]MBC9817020.1 adenylate/guanylate cyclase domain-containing protein [Nocardia farcinica]MBF6186833.1 adenylate/guanylate cyclase domain-containing protein [Nocardia farcinica]MBF6232183.1 adenylate/guanylate cyclase domain-containing protein [Nocardia farcinica]MBF6254934.1 adenylate/guanylate cyclase domain-containing protein [Nocardia farcinica]